MSRFEWNDPITTWRKTKSLSQKRDSLSPRVGKIIRFRRTKGFLSLLRFRYKLKLIPSDRISRDVFAVTTRSTSVYDNVDFARYFLWIIFLQRNPTLKYRHLKISVIIIIVYKERSFADSKLLAFHYYFLRTHSPLVRVLRYLVKNPCVTHGNLCERAFLLRFSPGNVDVKVFHKINEVPGKKKKEKEKGEERKSARASCLKTRGNVETKVNACGF